MIKKIIGIIFFLIIFSSVYSKPKIVRKKESFKTVKVNNPAYGLRKTKKRFQFNGTVAVNYTVINHEPFIQYLFIPEFTFGKIDFGFGFYLPLEQNRYYELRYNDYNSIQAFLGKIYYIQYGIPNINPVSVKISAIQEFTLGYGLILQRYSNDILFPEIKKLGTQITVSLSGFYFQGIIGDISTQSVAGGRLVFKAGEFLKSQSMILSSFELGASLITDSNPKKRDVVRVDSDFEQTIVQREDSSSFLYIWGVDIGVTLVDRSFLTFGLYSEFAKINLSGEGIGYGILGTFFPKVLKLNYKFQFRHFFNSFSPSYFNSFYDAERSTKIDSITNSSAQMGWYLELSRFFVKNKLGIIIAYDETFDGEYNPHLFFKFYTDNLPRRFKLTFRYDRFNIQEPNHLVNYENLDTLLLFELFYHFTKHVEIGISYRKGFTIEENPVESVNNLVNISIFTKILF